jgi:hypothetical protein
MKKIWLPLLFIFAFTQLKASNKDSTYIDSIRNIEYQLEGLSHNIINSADIDERITSCYYFIQTLKKALKVPTSYDYDFKLLKTVSITKPKDNKFRIFTWNLLLDSGRYMYFGAMQMNESDSLILYGLYDSSDRLKDPLFSTVDNNHWVGCLYYQIHGYKYKRQNYYLLFGWDGEDAYTNKKIIDVLWFNQDGKPQFGAPIFEVEEDFQHRLVFEFADRGVMLCRFEEQMNQIVYAHLVPTSPLLKGHYDHYLPDGTYDFLDFKKGFWVHGQQYFEKLNKRNRRP